MDELPRAITPHARKHKRQLTWQILVPVIAAAVIIITAAVLAVTLGSASNRVAADVSVMWLILPVIFLSLIFLALLVGLIYGTFKLYGIIPTFTGKIQGFLYSVEKVTHKVADGSAKPFILFDEVGAAIKALFKREKRMKRSA